MIEKSTIVNICSYANISNLNKILNNIKEDNKKEQIKLMFQNHMEVIADFCIDNFINEDKLTDSFIRGLHKIHYPKGYTESKKTLKGDGEYVYMIPGVYKTVKNFDYVDPKDVKNEMNIFIKSYNDNIITEVVKYDFILEKLISFLKIHPFGNGNGRVVSILIDLMLIKNELTPIFFKYIQEDNKNLFIENIKASIIKNNIEDIKKIIKK